MPRALRLVLLLLLLGCGWSSASARPIVWTRASDVASLDPHAQNDNIAHALYHQIYEPLLIRDALGKVQPALAESWELSQDPTVWQFKLRARVKFHDGVPLTADDVVFSLNRARQPTSEMRVLLASIEAVTRVDDLTVRIKTRGANPLLPWTLTNAFIMSKTWTEKNRGARVPDFRTPEGAFFAVNANGTGPYVLTERQPGQRTLLKRNDEYWGRGIVPLEIEEIEYRPIVGDDERVAAFTSGAADLIQDIPVQAIQKLAATPGVKINEGPENRTIFLGMNVGIAPLATSDVKDRNPFAIKAVRQAVNMTVNRQAIQKDVMLGHAIPTGTIVPPPVNGYVKQLDVIPPLDPAKAKELLIQAGFPDGFSVTLNCPKGRYVNDEAVCKAVSEQLSKIGIRVDVTALERAAHVALITRTPPLVDFYMMGFAVPTLDSDYMLQQLVHGRTARAGLFNGTRFSNPEIDKLIDGINQEADIGRRSQVISQIWRAVQEEVIYIPLHVQTLAYAMKSDLDLLVDIENQPKFKFVKFRKQQG